MAFQHIGDILGRVVSKTLTEACFLVGVEFKQVPADGDFHHTGLVNSTNEIYGGQIKIQPGGLRGVVRNTKTGKTQIFYVRSNSNVKPRKTTPPNKKQAIRKDSVGSLYLKTIKYRPTQKVRS